MFQVSYDWYDNQQTILLISITPDEWNWDDAVVILKEKVAWIQRVPHEVHVIYQFTFPPRIPKSNMFRQIGNLMNIRAENEGMNIFVGTNRLFETFVTTAATVSQLRWVHDRYRYVTSMQQAIDEINAYHRRRDSYA